MCHSKAVVKSSKHFKSQQIRPSYTLACRDKLTPCSFIHFCSLFIFLLYIIMLIYLNISLFSISKEPFCWWCYPPEITWLLEHRKHISISSNISVFLWYFSFILPLWTSKKMDMHQMTVTQCITANFPPREIGESVELATFFLLLVSLELAK